MVSLTCSLCAGCNLQDATGNWGGNLVLSTTAAGSTGTLTDRLTIDSSGLATFTGGLTLSSSATTLTVQGSTILGTSSAQTLTVNAASTFASTASFSASTAFTASGNVLLNGGSTQTLTVQATSTFSAPVAINAAVNVSGLGTFSGGVALTTPVTVNGVALAKVATTDNYTDLIGQPRFYAGSTSYATIAASTAPTQPKNISTWYGTGNVTGTSGAVKVYPTSDGTSTGTALFSSILSVSATAYASGASSAITIPTAALTGLTADLRTVTLTAVTGTTIVTVLAGGSASAVYASAGTLVMCTIVGTYSS